MYVFKVRGRLAQPPIVVRRRHQRNRGPHDRRQNHDHDQQLDERHAAGRSRVESRESRAGVRAQHDARIWLLTLDSKLLTFMLSQSQQMIVNVVRGVIVRIIGRVDDVKTGSDVIGRERRRSLYIGSEYGRRE